MKNVHLTKDAIKRMKRQATDQEKIFAKDISSLAGPQKAKHRITKQVINFTPRHIPKRTKNRNSNRYLYTSVQQQAYSQLPKVETTQVNINKYIYKQSVTYTSNFQQENRKSN